MIDSMATNVMGTILSPTGSIVSIDQCSRCEVNSINRRIQSDNQRDNIQPDKYKYSLLTECEDDMHRVGMFRAVPLHNMGTATVSAMYTGIVVSNGGKNSVNH
jgi:hypothetical protein